MSQGRAANDFPTNRGSENWRSSSGMIGPASSFYDPHSALQNSGHDAEAQYQQWVAQQQQQQQQQQPQYNNQNFSIDYGHYGEQQSYNMYGQSYYLPYQQQQQQPGSYSSSQSPDPTPQPQPTRKPNKASAKRKPAPTKTPASKRKRSRRSPVEDHTDSESDDDDLGGGISVGMGGLGVDSTGHRVSRLPGACTHCKKLKMKCDFPENENTCKRCKTGGHVCIVEGRKPRTAPNKREYLLAQIRQKDAIIESLLKQLHNPYIATPLSIASYRMATSPSDTDNKNVIAWLDKLQSSVRDAGGKGGTKAFKLDDRDQDDSDADSDQATSHLTHAQRYGLVAVDAEEDARSQGEDDAEKQEDEALQSSLPDSHVPLGLIANLSLSNNVKSKKRDDDEGDDDNVGVANATYFMPGPATDLGMRAMLIEQHSPPEILVHGLVTPDDVDKLFDIFYDRVNPFISLLDPVLHTPASTFARCPFLFTVICAISSRYYIDKSEIYPIAMHFAKHSASNALIDGWKSVELCQAYILMSIYAVPARRWEEDRSWLYTGLAIRIATDLNLHQMSGPKPQNEKQERELLNRTRVWMICFNLDRSTATQFGKPSTIKEDYIMRHSNDWYKKSQCNIQYDVHLCAYTALFRIVAKFHEEIFSDSNSPSGLNKSLDFRTVTLTHDAHLTRYKEEWTQRFKEAAEGGREDQGGAFRCLLLPFYVAYSRLVMFSFGFQQAYQRGIQSGDTLFLSKCLESAKTVVRVMIEELAPSGYMKYAPDGHFVFTSFASAFLLKLLRPEFNSLLKREEETEIFDLIGRLIQTLSGPGIAIDDRHTPKLHARFLAGLLSKHRRDGAGVMVGRLQTQPPVTQNRIQSQGSSEFQPTASTSMTTFSVSQPSHQSNMRHQSYGNPAPPTPIYQPEATYTAGTSAPISFGGGDIDLQMFNFTSPTGGELSTGMEDEMLATMQALKNPAWWQNMMMPGFSWSDPGSPASSRSSPGYQYPGHGHQQSSPLGGQGGFGMFHAAQPVSLTLS